MKQTLRIAILSFFIIGLSVIAVCIVRVPALCSMEELSLTDEQAPTGWTFWYRNTRPEDKHPGAESTQKIVFSNENIGSFVIWQSIDEYANALEAQVNYQLDLILESNTIPNKADWISPDPEWKITSPYRILCSSDNTYENTMHCVAFMQRNTDVIKLASSIGVDGIKQSEFMSMITWIDHKLKTCDLE